MTQDLFKILAICLITATICVILKQSGGQYSLLISITAGIVVLFIIFNNIAYPITDIFEKLSDYGIKSEYFKVALKATGIAYITSFIADACRDSGQTSLAAKAELAGKSAIFILSLPLINSILETAVGLIK